MAAEDGARLWHLEGLRGVACAQVVALHAFGTFVPGLVEGPGAAWQIAVRESPLRLLYDGDAAVFLFFVLSGCVLRGPFRRHADNVLGVLSGRVVRFLLPAVMACGLGWIVWRLMGAAAPAAAELIGSGWLGGGLAGAERFSDVLRDATLNALVLGYRDLSVFDPWIGGLLWPNGAGLNPPLWTLSVEMQGSLLVFGLVRAERLPRWAWALVVMAAATVCVRSPLLCFIGGYVAVGLPERPRLATWGAGVCGGWLLLGGGEALAGWVDAAHLDVLPGLSPELTRRGWAAILVFPALLRSDWCRRVLAGGVPRLLGRLSFPVYLVHWPLLFGPGAGAMLLAAPVMGSTLAAWVGLAVGVVASLAVAVPFGRLDAGSLRLGRWARELSAPQTAVAAG